MTTERELKQAEELIAQAKIKSAKASRTAKHTGIALILVMAILFVVL